MDHVVPKNIRAKSIQSVRPIWRVRRRLARQRRRVIVRDSCRQGAGISGRRQAAGEGDVFVTEDGEALVAVVEADEWEAE